MNVYSHGWMEKQATEGQPGSMSTLNPVGIAVAGATTLTSRQLLLLL
jgi:hypothetical protein